MVIFGSNKTINSQESAKKKPIFESYVDPSGDFSSKRLKYSLWFVTHKVFLRKASFVFLILISVVFWGLSIWWWGDYISYEIRDRSQLIKALVSSTKNTFQKSTAFSPRPIVVTNSFVTPGGVDKYDLGAEVANPNDRFVVFVDYYFVVDGEKTSVQKTTLLPNETRPFMYFGLKKTSAPSAPLLVFERIAWQRIQSQTVVNTSLWQKERLDFSIKDFAFTRAETAGVSSNQINFVLVNHSSFSYGDAHFYVMLFSQQSIVGVLPLEVVNFKSLESRSIDLRSFVTNLDVSEVKVYPLINVYNKSVFIVP
jgi:hypothetical protein